MEERLRARERRLTVPKEGFTEVKMKLRAYLNALPLKISSFGTAADSLNDSVPPGFFFMAATKKIPRPRTYQARKAKLLNLNPKAF